MYTFRLRSHKTSWFDLRTSDMYRIRAYRESDRCEVDRLLRDVYYPEEPLTRANGLQPEPALAAALLPQGHSYIATSLDGRIVGLSLNDEPPQFFPTIYTEIQQDEKFRRMFAYMEEVSGVLEAAPGAMEVRMLAVDPDWRGLGIATGLLAAARRAAQEARCPYIKLYCTSNHSSRLMEKLGWRLQYSMDYRDFLEKNPCDILLPEDPHTHCKLYIDTVQPLRSGEILTDRFSIQCNPKVSIPRATIQKLW